MTAAEGDAGVMTADDRAADEGGIAVPATRRVFVEDYELIGSVGVYEHERRYEQRIVASVSLLVTDGYDGRSDNIGEVYDYDHAIRAIRETVESDHFNLLETLAERIAQACLSNAAVVSARVRVAKPDVLIACKAVGIEIERARAS
jgi:dihydroneopterin aldolase